MDRTFSCALRTDFDKNYKSKFFVTLHYNANAIYRAPKSVKFYRVFEAQSYKPIEHLGSG